MDFRKTVLMFAVASLGLACNDDRPSDGEELGDSETGGDGDGDGDPTGDGDGDGDPTGDGDGNPTGDGDGDGDPTGDGDGDPTGDGDGDDVHDCQNPSWNPDDFDHVLDVGPGHPHETPSDVPWESLAASTLIRIHHRPEPYRDKWVIARDGTEDAPIVVLGVPDQSGQLPRISGEDAVTRTQLNFWNENRAIIKIGGASVPNSEPAHVWVECLDIGHAKPGYFFTDKGGQQREYISNAAPIFIELGHDLHIRNCELHDGGNGLFSASQSQDVLISGNYVHDNGIAGSIYEHNSYTESRGITFEYNHYGRLCEGCPGNNLKDRSAGTVIRYNWIEDGNRQLDLVDTDHQEILDDPRYSKTFVYGNILVEGDGQGNSQIIHYGGDSGSESWYRKGILHLYHNTVVSTRQGNTTLVRLSSEGESADIRNNILFVTAQPSNLAISAGAGAAILTDNWLPAGWVASHSPLTGSVTDMGNVEGTTPGFVDVDGQDFSLAEGSMCLDQAGPLHADALPVNRQYLAPQSSEPRPDDGAPDLGAFERQQ